MSEALNIAIVVVVVAAALFIMTLALAALEGDAQAERRKYHNTLVGPWARAFDLGFKLGDPEAAMRRRLARIERNRARWDRKNQEN